MVLSHHTPSDKSLLATLSLSVCWILVLVVVDTVLSSVLTYLTGSDCVLYDDSHAHCHWTKTMCQHFPLLSVLLMLWLLLLPLVIGFLDLVCCACMCVVVECDKMWHKAKCYLKQCLNDKIGHCCFVFDEIWWQITNSVVPWCFCTRGPQISPVEQSHLACVCL